MVVHPGYSPIQQAARRVPSAVPPTLALAASLALLNAPAAFASLDPPDVPAELTEARVLSPLRPAPWQPAPLNPAPPSWQAVSNEAVLGPRYLLPPDPRPQSELYGAPRTNWNRSIPTVGLGLGYRIMAQDDSLPVVQGSLRLLNTGDPVVSSVSARSTVTLPTRSNCDFGPGCQSEYRLAGTIDFFQQSALGLYFGGGAALNKDSLHKNYGMMVFGAELSMSRNLTLTTNINWIFNDQPDDTAQFGGLRWADVETIFSVNLRL